MKGDAGKEGRIIGGGECPTVDRFDGKIEECFSIPWYGCSPLTGGDVALLFPNKMKRDDNQKGDHRFDHT